ncbi:hypothetical protein SUGI_0328500 [Cryptomeria japonica]|nr:hypothetical protein SUGI_0328500 [Cryptomeria japonica]
MDLQFWKALFLAVYYSSFLACSGVFCLLIGWDVWRAYSKRAIWLPGKAFALTGVIVQIIVSWCVVTDGSCDQRVEVLIHFHQLIVTGRAAVCVFIGYLLPGMSAASVRTFVALAITISVQIASELLVLYYERRAIFSNPPQPAIISSDVSLSTVTWSTKANLVQFMCIVVLGLILGCTTVASKTIHGLLRQRISALSSINEENEFQSSNERTMSISWNDIEDEVLKSWFVARVCRIDYVIARMACDLLEMARCTIVFSSAETKLERASLRRVFVDKKHCRLNSQVSVVFFAKLCELLSEVIVGRFLYWFRKRVRKGDAFESREKYAKVLECVCMPGEDPSDLWEANQISFNNLKLLMQKGCENGMSSENVNSIFRLYSLQWAEDGAQLLNKLKKLALPSVSKHFPSIEKECVKMTVVSLITIFTGLHKAKSDSLRKVCCEVWDLLGLADRCDVDLNEDNEQVCMAADREFYKLQKEYDKLSFGCDEGRRFLEDLLENSEGLLRRENLLGDCKVEVVADAKDWVKITPTYTIYKLCKLMLDEDVEDFVAWIEESLRNQNLREMLLLLVSQGYQICL